MKFSDINIRDPFILYEDGVYYLYGTRGPETWGDSATGLDVYVSTDMQEWSSPVLAFDPPADFWSDRNFWAPEVHKYKGRYYMLATFTDSGFRRGTQILAAESPVGPFVPHSDGPVTPEGWVCLDGTLYVEDGKPYMVFCHEWKQVVDGQMCVIRLSDDLKSAVGEPVILFRASEPEWAERGAGYFVTDGPFLYRTRGKRLIMLWSSYTDLPDQKHAYCEALAYSETGSILGPWKHGSRLLFSRDGGHGMLFRTGSGDLKFIFHTPNNTLCERPRTVSIEERNDDLFCADPD